MKAKPGVWLNRCIVLIILLLSNLGALQTDAQPLEDQAQDETSLAKLSRPIFDGLNILEQYPIQFYNTPSSNKSTVNSYSDFTRLSEAQFSTVGLDVLTGNYSDPNLYSPAMSDLLEVELCPTPMTLMLHSSFGVTRMRELADQIEQSNLITLTYRSVLQSLLEGRSPPSNGIIITLDDLGTQWLRDDFVEMIDVFTERGMVLVIGLIVHGPQDPAIWEYLRELDNSGVEIASHTIDHFNLPQLTDPAIQRQVIGSYKTICEYIGKCPITLILPFGNLDRKGKILEIAADYTFVVGIQDGRSFSGKPPWYLGRSPPHDTNQTQTILLLEKTFQSEPASY